MKPLHATVQLTIRLALLFAIAIYPNAFCSAESLGSSTSELVIQGNLSPVAPIGAPSDRSTFGGLASTAAVASEVVVYDSLGQSHLLRLFFYHTLENRFAMMVFASRSEIETIPGGPDSPRSLLFNNGDDYLLGIQFGPDGRLVADQTSSPAVITWNNGSLAQSLQILYPNVTQVAGSSALTVSQNGYPPNNTELGSAFVPAVPSVKVQKRSVRLILETQEQVRYQVVASRGDDRIQFTTSDPHPSLESLKPGKWSFKYRLLGKNGADEFSTRFSKSKEGVIR